MPQKREKTLEFLLCLCDCVAAVISFWCAGFIRYGNYATFRSLADISEVTFILVMVTLASYYIMNVFDDFIHRGLGGEILKVGQLNFAILVGMTVYTFSTKNAFTLSRLTLGYLLVVNVVLDLGLHAVMKRVFRKGITRRSAQDRRLLLFVPAAEAEVAVLGLKGSTDWRYYLCGVVSLDGGTLPETVLGVPVVAGIEDYLTYATQNVVDEVLILCGAQQVHEETIRRVITDFESMGIAVSLQIETIQTDVGDIKTVGRMGDYDVMTFSTRTYDYRLLMLKRTMDIVGGLVGLLVTCVIGVVLAPILLIESPGPLLFAQERVGRNGRTFKLYKFRSMCKDAEAQKPALMKQNKMKGKIFKMDDDPRVTRVGRFIRKTSLDEFPQFWNVLRGDMSLVGTRPPTLAEYADYTHLEKRRLSFRPGLTGLWQISGRNDIEDFDEIVKLDVAYIENWSIGLDVEILLKTVRVLFVGKGAV